MEAFANDKSNAAETLIPTFDGAENIEGKGENAGDQHFLIFPQCFLHFQRQIPICQPHQIYLLIPTFDGAENIVGKIENAGNQHFLLFPQCFQMPSL